MSYIINEVLQRGHHVAEVTSDAEQAWVEQIVAMATAGAGGGGSFLQDCTPGYYNREGHPERGVAQNAPYVPGINAFNRLLQEWREQVELSGYELSG